MALPLVRCCVKKVRLSAFLLPHSLALAAAFAVLLGSCATTNHFAPVDKMVDDENFSQSAVALEKKTKTAYRKKDKVLYFLDKGMLTHYAGDYKESSALLENGERAIEANFAVSVSQEIGTFVLNDTTREYDGEDYEDIYLNVFNALNYYHQGDMEGALVEIRRMNNKLQNLSVKYGALMSKMQKLALEKGTDIPPNPDAPVKFNNSALARYLGMLFYRGIENMDSARIDQQQLRVAMADSPSIYQKPVPSSIADELIIPDDMARLNVISFTGRSPVKEEEVERVFLGAAWIKFALPVMKPIPSRIASISVDLDSGESFNMELLEDISAVVSATFTQKENIIYTKSVIRASVKGITTQALYAAADKSDDAGTSGLLFLFGIGSQIFSEASEKADLRGSRYFPGKAYVGGVNLPPGTYSLTVTYYGRNQETIAKRRYENISVTERVLNLIEDVCLK
jgi:hypothetical protein